MKIIGDRVLVERVEKERGAGFETVDVMDDFVSKGRIVMVGEPLQRSFGTTAVTYTEGDRQSDLAVGNVVVFAKWSPDTQEMKVEGKDMKVVAIPDIIAVL